MIVRQRPSPNIVNSRKKLVLGILERYGQERLGLEGESADASMFRTILFNNGLYFQDKSKRWRFAQPDELGDERIQDVWAKFKKLLTKPKKGPKDLGAFIRKLQEPPYGLRFGVIPILFAAALKAFPSPLSIVRTNGEYLGDILPSHIEEICKSPQSFRLVVLSIGGAEETYLAQIRDLFGSAPPSKAEASDLVRECYDAIEQWKHDRPPGALTSRLVSKEAQQLQVMLTRNSGPTDLLFNAFPRLAGNDDLETVHKVIKVLLMELQAINDTYRQRVARAIRSALSTGLPDGNVTMRELAADWANCFPDEFVASIDDAKSRALLKQLKGSYLDDATFLNMLVTMVADKAPKRWEDKVIFEFEEQLREMVDRVENQALESATSGGSAAVRLNLAGLVERRIAGLIAKLEEISGQEAAQRAITRYIGKATSVKEERIG
jgi:hypothetical protein